jgi:DNA-binding transcriptional ArsR family regulator
MSPKQLERIIKGFANYRRLEIALLLEKRPGLTVEDISKQLSIGYMNAGDHLRKLSMAGLVSKRPRGTSVSHTLTSRGTAILVFCKKLK